MSSEKEGLFRSEKREARSENGLPHRSANNLTPENNENRFAALASRFSPLASPYISQLDAINPFAITGSVVQTVGQTVIAEGFPVPVGAVAEIVRPGLKPVFVQAIGFKGDKTLLSPYDSLTGVRSGNQIRLVRSEPKLKIGTALLGRVIDALGNPVDEGPDMVLPQRTPFINAAPQARLRPKIDQILSTGVRAIDALLTCGRGQRLGIFAGSGVGKSTLLGMMARYAKADVIVLGLVGERGRELNEFIERDLGAEGLAKSVIVVSTSDEPAIKRSLSCYTATAIAEYFRNQGKDVLLLLDSLTRFAQAKREVGLAAGEPAAARGYPPSVFASMAPLLERAGRTQNGSITAFYTVLVEGDDENEPVADAVRGLLDGHIWLSRKLAQAGHFPAIDILKSVSRLANELVDSKLRRATRAFRQTLATYHDCEDLISIGAYKHGSNPLVDDAIRLRPAMMDFLQQSVDDQYDYQSAKQQLEEMYNIQ